MYPHKFTEEDIKLLDIVVPPQLFTEKIFRNAIPKIMFFTEDNHIQINDTMIKYSHSISHMRFLVITGMNSSKLNFSITVEANEFQLYLNKRLKKEIYTRFD